MQEKRLRWCSKHPEERGSNKIPVFQVIVVEHMSKECIYTDRYFPAAPS